MDGSTSFSEGRAMAAAATNGGAATPTRLEDSEKIGTEASAFQGVMPIGSSGDPVENTRSQPGGDSIRDNNGADMIDWDQEEPLQPHEDAQSSSSLHPGHGQKAEAETRGASEDTATRAAVEGQRIRAGGDCAMAIGQQEASHLDALPTEPVSANGEEEAISTREVRSLEGDGQPWMLVELRQGSRRAMRSRQWALKNTAFSSLKVAEAERVAEFKRLSQQHGGTLALLQRQHALGREEQSECASFLTQRAAADAAYAHAMAKQRLGGRAVTALADLRSGDKYAVLASGAAPLCDASGCAEVRAALSVLGCMVAQCSEKLLRFAESGALAKELTTSLEHYAADGEQIVLGYAATVLEELSRLDKLCADAFSAHALAFDSAQKEASVEGTEVAARDLWLTEFHFRSAVAAFNQHVWNAGREARLLLERFRELELRRVSTLRSSLRVFISLQQRLWADISASTSAVHALHKDSDGATGLSEEPSALALETLLEGANRSLEYVSRQALAPSLLVVHEGLLAYQRAVIRTWVSCYCVLTTDRFMHCFNAAAEHSSLLRSDQLLFSIRLDVHASTARKSESDFTVTAAPKGILGKVGLGGGGAVTTFRAASAAHASEWERCLLSTGPAELKEG